MDRGSSTGLNRPRSGYTERMVEEAPEIDPEEELWGVEEGEETSISIDELADLDEDSEVP